LLLLIVSTAAQAQVEDLGIVEVTSGRYEAPAKASTKPVTIIDRKAIEASHVENVIDLLRGEANIVVRDSSGIGAKAQVDLGGFGEASPANLVVLSLPVFLNQVAGSLWMAAALAPFPVWAGLAPTVAGCAWRVISRGSARMDTGTTAPLKGLMEADGLRLTCR